MFFFLWGRWRHDVVSGGALVACIFAGLIPPDEAFAGFGHPAVITVGCVLILSYGLQITGAVDVLAKYVLPSSAGPVLSITALTGLAALLSGFMNNVGALALLMPVGLQIAEKQEMPPGKVLMPLAFGSILGGTMTLIGTPPNLIISGFRAEAGLGGFSMFDFSPVGLAITCTGVLFVGLVGWRLVPERKHAAAESFDTGAYLSEVRILEGSNAVGMRLRETEELLEEADAQIIGLVRNDFHVVAPNPGYVVRADDILVIEAEPESISTVLSSLGLKFEEDVRDEEDGENSGENQNDKKPCLGTHCISAAGDEKDGDEGEEKKSRDEIVVQELVVLPNSTLTGRSATDIQLRTRYGINLLAISRRGRRSIKRLRSTQIQAGDVLLMHGAPEALSGFAAIFDCLPLAARDIRVPRNGQALIAAIVMGLSIGAAALGILPAAVSFAAGVLFYVLLRIVPPRSVYSAIDWPVIVLLAAMLPVAGAMASTGTADLIAGFLLESVAGGSAVTGLTVILVGTMLLTDFMNNAATAAVMAPIAFSTALQLGVNPDSFLMAVAIGASCAFLTPIGHQNNTLILGPGGFSFGDYWRMGLPTDLLVAAVSIPMLLLVWPL